MGGAQSKSHEAGDAAPDWPVGIGALGAYPLPKKIVEKTAGNADPCIAVEVLGLSGASVPISISPQSTVLMLKQKVSRDMRLDIACLHLELTLFQPEWKILEDQRTLEEAGVYDGAQLTMVKKEPPPPFADSRGFTREHESLLQTFFQQHNAVAPAPWEPFQKTLDGRAQRMQEKLGDADVHLSKDGVPKTVFRVQPGETLSFQASGCVQNHIGPSTTAIQQVLLACDTEIVGDLYNGVPMTGEFFERTVQFVAPSQPGVYMLWRRTTLLYTLQDAHASFHGNCREMDPRLYPGKFVGWLKVTGPEQPTQVDPLCAD